MHLPRKGQKGFTLIELLIVVAILGVLAAVVIPNVGRFLGRGEEEARRAEFHNVSSAIIALMTDTGITAIPNPVNEAGDVAVTDMTTFPDSTSVGGSADKAADASDVAFTAVDDPGYLLYEHDGTGGGVAGPYVNYVTMTQTTYYYTCESDGTVRQWDGAEPSTGTEYTY